MKTKKQRIVLLIIFILATGFIIYFFMFSSTWKNNRYRFLYGNHLHLIKENKELFWFDVVHTNNPDDIMFEYLENDLIQFMPDLVLVEGSADDFDGTLSEALYSGENSFAAFIAKENNICVEDIEPPVEMQIAYLKSKYMDDEILAMYLLRQIGSLEAMPDSVDIDADDFFQRELSYWKNKGLEHEVETTQEVFELLNDYLPEPMNTDNVMNLKVYRIYAKSGSALNEIYMDILEYRNIYLVELIEQKRKEFDRIFVVMGGQHLIDTQKQLSEIYLS